MPTLNAIISQPDDRDYKFLARLAPLPVTDLRVFNRDIEDQGQQGSCTLNTVTNALELLTQRAGQWEDLSRQFGYYTVRQASGLLGQEGAYSLRDVLETVRKLGLCLESEWPYSAAAENLQPLPSAYVSAATRKVMRYEAIDISKSRIFGTNPQLGIDNINAALAEGMPVLIALAVGHKFMQLSGPLFEQHYPPIDMPGVDPTGNEYMGGHAVTIVGNNHAAGGWIVENSWGTTWGDFGYGLLPYSHMGDLSEAWIIRSYKDLDFTDPVLYAQQMRLVKMYVAVLGRAPELSGFKWWLDVITSGADTLYGAANGFMSSAESKARFPTDGQIVCEIIDTQSLFANRIDVAAYFVLDLACDNLTVAKVALDGVTADPATVPIAKKRIRQLLGQGVL